jgi:autophagy-related protein 9
MSEYEEITDYDEMKKNASFFSDIYIYFIRGGYWCIFVENILNIIITISTLLFLIFVSFFLDWDSIGECESEATCKNIKDYIITPTTFHSSTTSGFMILFLIIFFIYWVSISAGLVIDMFKFFKYKNYFKNKLGVDTDELKVLAWSDVVKKIMDNDKLLTPEIIIGSIMKKDNYLIAMVSSNIFRINSIFYTNTFLWLINVCILNQIFPKNTTIMILTCIDYERIKRTLKVIGVIQIILLPFTFTIMLVHYIINFTTDIYTQKTYIGPKEWTLYGKFLFREYNELPHIFNDRLIKSYKYAVQYEQKFNVHMMNIIMEKIIFLLGTHLTFLVIMTLYDERLVMYINLFNRNLLWYIAILTSAISVFRLMTVSPSTVDESSEEIMHKMIKHTHYFPDRWKGKCHQYGVYSEVMSMYKYKIIAILLELLSVIVIPFYMIFKISESTETIAKFIEKNTVYNNTIGYICKHSVISHFTISTNSAISGESVEMDTFSIPVNSSIIGSGDETTLLLEDNKRERSTRNFISYYSGSRIVDSNETISANNSNETISTNNSNETISTNNSNETISTNETNKSDERNNIHNTKSNIISNKTLLRDD